MSGPRIGELFAGMGGLGMGVQAVYGGEVAWVSEFDKGANKILAHRFPGVPNHGDITKIDWAAVEPVDILTGGSPCQDLSHAGRRAGMTEGTCSNLWVAMREAIAQLRPPMVVWENVGGAFSAAAHSEVEPCAGCVGDGSGVFLRALGRVLGDLSSLGYDASWHALRAADVGAPHGRLRVFVVAYPVGSGRDGRAPEPIGRPESRAAGSGEAAGDPDGAGRGSLGRLVPLERDTDGRGRADGPGTPTEPAALLPSPRTSDTNGAGRHGDGGLDLRTAVSLLKMAEALADWGQYAAAIARWETLTRPAPPPTETGPKGSPRLSAAFSEWMMGLAAGWITDVPGITRNEALKACGNGVVPQQAAEALRVMAAWEVAA